MYYQAVFKKEHYNGKGTYLQVYVPGVDIQEKYFDLSGLANGMIRIDDGRTISAAQRGLIYSVFNDIRVWRGDSHKRIGIEKVKLELKADFCVESNLPMFSLSDVSMEIAGEFIDYVLDYAFNFDIPLTIKLFEVSKTVRNWSYLCFKHRKCTVCGKNKSEVHHLDAVGRRNRNRVDHSKMQLIMLCREHHQEAHSLGDETFLKKYYVAGIFVPVATLKALNIRGDYGEEANV
nr:MAG TPA: Putative HNHc nuclease [Caudoviricetes sp.]